MPTAPIKFGPGQQTGWSELAGGRGVAMNVIIDGKGAVKRRPGIVASSLALSTVIDASGIDGLFSAVSGDIFAVAKLSQTAPGSMRQIYRVLPTLAVALDATASVDVTKRLAGDKRPTFAETQSIVAITAGAAPQKVVLDGYVSSRISGGPPDASHVAANASRLLLNRVDDFQGFLYYSDVAAGSAYSGFQSWQGTGSSGALEAQGRPDPIVAIGETTNEVYAFGSTTTQVFVPDASNAYAAALTVEHGCSAPYSIIRLDDGFAWRDDKRRFVIGTARDAESISAPIQRDLDALSETSDCFGYRFCQGDIDCLIWTFPTDQRTFVFQKDGGWSQWSSYSTANNWDLFPVTAHSRVPGTATNLVGLSTGKVAELSLSALDDLGEPIVAATTSNYEDHGSLTSKLCKGVHIKMRRGTTSSTTEPVGYLCWRDRPGEWQGRIPVGLGASGDREVVVQRRSLGTYRARQWGWEFSGSVEMELASVVEDYEVLAA